MKRINFYYSTKLTFDDYVHNHSFALRIIPPETPSQINISCALNINPFVSTQQTIDAFGNNVTSGYLREDHRFLDFEIKGTADIDHTKYRTDYMPCYLYQSEYTQPDSILKNFYDGIKGNCTGSASERAAYLSNVLSDTISNYGSTGVYVKKRSVSGFFSYTYIASENGWHCRKIYRRACVLRR